jgi:hypothetical protein
VCASSGAHDLSIFFVMCVLAAVSRRAYDRASNDVIILPPSEHRVHTFGCEMIITGLCTTSSICSQSMKRLRRHSMRSRKTSTLHTPSQAKPPTSIKISRNRFIRRFTLMNIPMNTRMNVSLINITKLFIGIDEFKLYLSVMWHRQIYGAIFIGVTSPMNG